MTARSSATTWIHASVWAGLATLLTLRAALSVSPLAFETQELLGTVVAYLIPTALACIGCSAIALRTLGRPTDHRFWGLLSIATACVLIGETYWSWYSVNIDFHGPPLNSTYRLLYLVALFCFLGMLMSLTRAESAVPSRRLRFVVDIASGVAATYPFVYLLWTLPAFANSENPVGNAAQAALYPIFGASMCVSIVWVMVGHKASRWRAWERLSTASLVIFGLGLFAFPVWYPSWLASTTQPRDWFSMVLGSGMYLLFAAAVYRLTVEADQSLADPVPLPAMTAPVISRANPTVHAAALPVLGWLVYRLHESSVVGPVLVATVMLAVLLAGRSWLASLELTHFRLKSVTDPETGAYNARYLYQRLEDLIAVSQQGSNSVSIALFVIDDYQQTQRSYSAAVAASVAGRVADVLRFHSPRGAEVFRVRGDEFVVAHLSYDTDQFFAAATEAVRLAAERPRSDGEPPITAHAGIAAFPEHAADAEGLLACARIAVAAAQDASLGTRVAVFDPRRDGAEDEGGIRHRRISALRGTVRALAAAVDARDSATKDHSDNVATLARDLGHRMGLAEERIDLLDLAAHMHDVGKIGIPDEILFKPGPLTADERATVRDHCELGERILAPANLTEILPIVRHHHERWDGFGYPDGLQGHQIPLEARILAVCDTFETMTGGRAYRIACSAEESLAEIEKNAGSQFDPIIAATFVELHRSHAADERSALRLATKDTATETA